MIRICGSVGENSTESLEIQIKKALSLGADYVEIRFDFLKRSDIDAAIKIAESIKSRAVFTLRSADEGGRFEGSECERIALLKKLSRAEPMLLDVEYLTLKDNDELADFLLGQKTRILISWHDFKYTPCNDKLRSILDQMRIYSSFAKIVTTANNSQDALRVLELYEGITGIELIAFAMGELGLVSRILCTMVGNAPFTYAAIERTTAPGQLDLSYMRRLFNRINSCCNYKPNANRR
ncbi:MAG: type I 3-dehydroquinate dehydratase [Thermoproteota archaeon]|nr:type I 3-dehydroquinate dehydratase [Thermoproteota archaeon]